MTDNTFENVTYFERVQSVDKEKILLAMTDGRPGILLTAHSVENGLGFDIDLVGGVTIDLIEPFLEKALAAIRKLNEENILPE